MCQSCANISAELALLTKETYGFNMAPLTIMDPEGDVLFVLGDFEFRVSSKALSLASPVFKAMFGPNFAEGQGLALGKGIRRIEMHDDDPEAMNILCKCIQITN